jgi:hypothetical protein
MDSNRGTRATQAKTSILKLGKLRVSKQPEKMAPQIYFILILFLFGLAAHLFQIFLKIKVGTMLGGMASHTHLFNLAIDTAGYYPPSGPGYIFQMPTSPAVASFTLYPCQPGRSFWINEAALLSITGAMTP